MMPLIQAKVRAMQSAQVWSSDVDLAKISNHQHLFWDARMGRGFATRQQTSFKHGIDIFARHLRQEIIGLALKQ